MAPPKISTTCFVASDCDNMRKKATQSRLARTIACIKRWFDGKFIVAVLALVVSMAELAVAILI